ncbi:hypothetical protein [Bacillus swezeyi]|nr:hypothetical protein [Bacillus swezeyi]
MKVVGIAAFGVSSIGPNYFLNLYWEGSKEDENSSFGQANDLEHFQIE